MKKTGLLVVLCLAGWASAEPAQDTGKKEPIVMRLEAVQVSDELAHEWKQGWRIKASELEDEGVRRLQTTEVVGVTERECSAFVGRKNHIVYYDPRASQFQVQYVDVGAKLDCKCKMLTTGKLSATVYTELSWLEKNLNDGKASYPQTITLKSQLNSPPFEFGERLLVGNVQGVEAQHYLQVLGGSGGAKNDNVYFVLSVERL